jgi:hypothetical protein
MVAACKTFHGGNLPLPMNAVLGALPIPNDLRDVATTFVKLQEGRHRADYNLAEPFRRREVLSLLQELVAAFRNP